VSRFITRRPRADVYFDDRLLTKTDWARLALRLLIPLSVIALAAAARFGVIP
jgi:hypothetical protein